MPIQTATGQPYRASDTGPKPSDAPAKGYFSYLPNECWRPNVNLYENDTAYLVCVDLAGVDKAGIDVTVEGQTLHIHGARAVPSFEECAEQHKSRVRLHLMEIDHGPFSRSVELPADIEKDQIIANHRNGMLWIQLPKKRT